ncbi:hypothetical protein DXV76_02750 [Rhodobacteraceae bacterium CCMM004]|nr:hypothetical protein DXV76_02750 [Rhodobacteraceae bacterium CCMM004]
MSEKGSSERENHDDMRNALAQFATVQNGRTSNLIALITLIVILVGAFSFGSLATVYLMVENARDQIEESIHDELEDLKLSVMERASRTEQQFNLFREEMEERFLEATNDTIVEGSFEISILSDEAELHSEKVFSYGTVCWVRVDASVRNTSTGKVEIVVILVGTKYSSDRYRVIKDGDWEMHFYDNFDEDGPIIDAAMARSFDTHRFDFPLGGSLLVEEMFELKDGQVAPKEAEFDFRFAIGFDDGTGILKFSSAEASLEFSDSVLRCIEENYF